MGVSAMSEEGKTVSVEVKSLKKGGFCMIRDQPCKITEMTQKPKATSKGNDRIHLVGVHMSTGKKHEDTLLATLPSIRSWSPGTPMMSWMLPLTRGQCLCSS